MSENSEKTKTKNLKRDKGEEWCVTMMKGKGKKDIEEKSNSPVLEFKKIDLSRECPKYLEILDRNIDEGIKLEELDALQLEIEALLVSVVYRKRQIQDEIDYSSNLQDSKDRPKDALKRSKGDDRPNKKFKEDAENSDHSSAESSSVSGYSNSSSSFSSSSKSSLKAKVKNLKVNKLEETKFNASYNLAQQNDVPNQFWDFVSTFCGPVKRDYLKMLEDIVSLYESEPEILKTVSKKSKGLTSNGKLSSDEQNGTSKKDGKLKKERKKGLSSLNSSDGKTKKSKEKLESNDKCDYGILTQRLVSCLIEEDFCAENFEDIFEDFSSDSRSDATDSKLLKTISLNNAAQFEKLLRKELEQHGLIDSDDVLLHDEGSDNESDEMNQEIVRYQNELRSIMAQNQFQIKKLVNLIKQDLKKQQIVKRLDQVNEEILEISKRLIIIKQKRKNSKEAKKERESVRKHLDERATLLGQLNSEKF